jgi:hypothetical protein
MITTQKEIRKAFWASHADLDSYALKWGIKTAPQNRHNATTRTAFVDFINTLAEAGEISSELALRATL